MAASGVLLDKQGFRREGQPTLLAVVEACTVPVVVAAVITGVVRLLAAMGPSELLRRAPQEVSQVQALAPLMAQEARLFTNIRELSRGLSQQA